MFFALELIGAVANKVNPDFRVRELDYILRFSGSRAFVCPRDFKGFDYVGMARAAAADAMPGLEHVVVSGAARRRRVEPGAGHRRDAADRRRTIACAWSADEIFRMAFTSGTTGDPKCVLHSFNTTLPAVRQINADMGVTETDVLLDLPAGRPQLGLPLPAADDRRRQPRGAARALLGARPRSSSSRRERVTYIATAPASIVAMLNEPGLDALRPLLAARRHHRRRLGRDRDDPRLPGAHARAT